MHNTASPHTPRLILTVSLIILSPSCSSITTEKIIPASNTDYPKNSQVTEQAQLAPAPQPTTTSTTTYSGIEPGIFKSQSFDCQSYTSYASDTKAASLARFSVIDQPLTAYTLHTIMSASDPEKGRIYLRTTGSSPFRTVYELWSIRGQHGSEIIRINGVPVSSLTKREAIRSIMTLADPITLTIRSLTGNEYEAEGFHRRKE